MDYIFLIKALCIMLSFLSYLSCYRAFRLIGLEKEMSYNRFIFFFLAYQRGIIYRKIERYYSAEVYMKIGIDFLYDIILPVIFIIVIVSILIYKIIKLRKSSIHKIALYININYVDSKLNSEKDNCGELNYKIMCSKNNKKVIVYFFNIHYKKAIEYCKMFDTSPKKYSILINGIMVIDLILLCYKFTYNNYYSMWELINTWIKTITL